MKKMTMQTVKNASDPWDNDEFLRADLAHAVNTLGAALRALKRHPQYRPVGQAEARMFHEDLAEDLYIMREKEKRDLQNKDRG